MPRIALLAALLALPPPVAPAADAPAPPEAPTAREVQCRAWAASAYPSGIEESACTAEFALPSPFLLVCVRGQARGYASPLQRDACADLFARSAVAARQGYVRP